MALALPKTALASAKPKAATYQGRTAATAPTAAAVKPPVAAGSTTLPRPTATPPIGTTPTAQSRSTVQSVNVAKQQPTSPKPAAQPMVQGTASTLRAPRQTAQPAPASAVFQRQPAQQAAPQQAAPARTLANDYDPNSVGGTVVQPGSNVDTVNQTTEGGYYTVAPGGDPNNPSTWIWVPTTRGGMQAQTGGEPGALWTQDREEAWDAFMREQGLKQQYGDHLGDYRWVADEVHGPATGAPLGPQTPAWQPGGPGGGAAPAAGGGTQMAPIAHGPVVGGPGTNGAPVPLPQGQYQTQMQGLDFTQPGALEEFAYRNMWQMMLPTNQTEAGAWWQGNQDQYWTPGVGETLFGTKSDPLFQSGMGENYASTIGSRYGNGTPGVTNRADEVHQTIEGQKPRLSEGPGLDPYYDNAERRAEEKIRTSMAARGMLGTTATDDQVSEMLLNLESEKANREADYELAAAAEDRNWAGLDVSSAASADTSSGRESQNELSWTQGVGNLLFSGQGLGQNRLTAGLNLGNDAQRLGFDRLNAGSSITSSLDDAVRQRFTAGADVAGGAQTAQRARGQDYFNNQMGYSSATAGLMGDQYNRLIGEDRDVLDAIVAMRTGLGAELFSNATRRTDQAQTASTEANAKRDELIRTMIMFGLMA